MTPLSRPLVRLAAFGVAGVMSTVVVVNTLSVPVRGDTRSQTAEFIAVDGLRSGNDVTLAGVRVGRVNEVRYATDGTHSTAVVHFSVADAVPVPADVTAAVRYGDMLGARYLALVPPENPTGSLVDGDHIPVERTTPPVDLTALVNGFKPLFDAIDPEQVTLLARSIVDAFQGEAATVDSLLRNVEAVTSGLANNEVVLTELITDLDSVLGTMNLHGDEVTRLITGLTDMSRTVADRNADVITVLDQGSRSIDALASLMTSAAQPFDTAVADSVAMTDAWIPNTAEFDRTMTVLPQLARSINHLGDYGGWLNLYTCNFTVKVGDSEANIFGAAHTEICR